MDDPIKCKDCKYHVLVNCYYGLDGFCLHPKNTELERKSLDSKCPWFVPFTCKDCKHLKFYSLANKYRCTRCIQDRYGNDATSESTIGSKQEIQCNQFEHTEDACADMHKFDAELRKVTRKNIKYCDYWWMRESE